VQVRSGRGTSVARGVAGPGAGAERSGELGAERGNGAGTSGVGAGAHRATPHGILHNQVRLLSPAGPLGPRNQSGISSQETKAEFPKNQSGTSA
jgi:hypothetical protein